MRRVLVANRGEIALRIIRACHHAGFEAVAAYSDADTASRWVELADDAVHIGGSPAAKSYLNADAVLDAAKRSGADAIHPGYGFLAENAAFARRVAEAGLTFVGPPAEVIEKMGDKATARRMAQEAGVPVVPGSDPVTSVEAAEAAAAEVGFPLLVKASAGGGGRGIRPVGAPDELAAVLPTAQAEASAAFGDGTVYLERLIERARHIEVQVLADHHGNAVHAFERDCSVQRRRQKLIEEAPAPGLPAEVRTAITDAAVRLARHVGYRNAGTVEFLLAEDGQFHFIEMNTRIQVEHPITECVTGVDLVAEQLRIASGAPLSFAQDDLALTGAAVELRINAEDPDADFRPAPGELSVFDLPGGPGVRVDTGFTAGDRISPFYDSMIAKLVCWGATREEALSRARQAVAELRFEGVPSTAGLHARLLPQLAPGPVHTRWLEEWLR
ncbi:acetyl-CoA carboxylase biotin carboxylase subunit [Amycolatopsis acidiphila]|uniref:biotin carboxylase n=1 Tax=Amycolatopsis acidiphila TaxID=715473 RepID=A0A558A4J4_9PSEU|nr:acetyl-CoA carboxylase biotin carboxylase subunit [Amycolatopsis acidiphila]TVT19177.1 acetyl-CoA carboxylase biotin carboxylase subunit [Amycolatopsis acidiphila]UIJ61991.1 acetyl-CoA carboxylase biotin carboxylase subunit [Amycolatopsis acidiphila]